MKNLSLIIPVLAIVGFGYFAADNISWKLAPLDCVAGTDYKYQVVKLANNGWSQWYNLKVIAPKKSVYYGKIVKQRKRVVEKAFQKVSCFEK